jgi:hypothetical protein
MVWPHYYWNSIHRRLKGVVPSDVDQRSPHKSDVSRGIGHFKLSHSVKHEHIVITPSHHRSSRTPNNPYRQLLRLLPEISETFSVSRRYDHFTAYSLIPQPLERLKPISLLTWAHTA